MNGAGLAVGFIAQLGASGGCKIMGAETSIHSEMAELGGLRIVTEGGLVRKT